MLDLAKQSSEIIIVSNRAPISDFKKGAASISVGGLTSALHGVAMETKSIWVFAGDKNSVDYLKHNEVPGMDYELSAVEIADKAYKSYYGGYSNSTIWPLFHYSPDKCLFLAEDWEAYKAVNKSFAEHIADLVKDKPEAVIWVQDYHLFLVAQYLRELGVENSIGFFLHIPFPTYELFRILPQRREVMEALLDFNLLGFHTKGYVSNFRRSVRRLVVGAEAQTGAETIQYKGRQVQIKDFPISIDTKAIAKLACSEKIQRRARHFRNSLASQYIGLGVDRLDYSKGLPQKLKALEHFFKKKSKYRGKVTFVQIAVPTRGQVDDYKRIKEETEQMVSRINGLYGTLDWSPIVYIHRSVPFEMLLSYYHMADFCLVTPLRDGMNLVAKEFIAARSEGANLILSELAGAADAIEGAYLVNPYNFEQIADDIEHCLEYPDDQSARLEYSKQRFMTYDVHKWARDFIAELTNV